MDEVILDFRIVLHEVGYKIRKHFEGKDVQIVRGTRDTELIPYQTHVDVKAEELKKPTCAHNVATLLIEAMGAKQNSPDKLFVYKLEAPKSVSFSCAYDVNGFYLRGICEYYMPTNEILCRFDILYS